MISVTKTKNVLVGTLRKLVEKISAMHVDNDIAPFIHMFYFQSYAVEIN